MPERRNRFAACGAAGQSRTQISPTVSIAAPARPTISAVGEKSGVIVTCICDEPVSSATPPQSVATPPTTENPHPISRFTAHPLPRKPARRTAVVEEMTYEARVAPQQFLWHTNPRLSRECGRQLRGIVPPTREI